MDGFCWELDNVFLSSDCFGSWNVRIRLDFTKESLILPTFEIEPVYFPYFD